MDFERDEGKTLACCARLQSDVTIEADIDEEPDAEVIPVRDFKGRVSRIVLLTPTIKGIWLKLDQPLHFQAGQYVNLQIPTLDVSRSFSLANSPQTGDEVELNVRIVSGGEGTAYLHDKLKVGDAVQLSGPYGRFFVRGTANAPTLFMEGGSGLSSPRSMILDQLAHGSTLPITLVYGQRTSAELYYHDEFLDLEQRRRNFTYVPALSHEPEDSPWKGFRGFVHEAGQAHFAEDFRGHKACLCGPPLMIDACISPLMQGRLFEKDIYTEKFLLSGRRSADSQPSLQTALTTLCWTKRTAASPN